MSTNQIPNVMTSDPSLRGYSRYPAQAVPKLGVRYAGNPSKTMVLASARNASGPQDVITRPRNEVLQEYRNDIAPAAMNPDRNELYYQAHIAHLQGMLAREHTSFTRLLIGSVVVCLVMLLAILYLAVRPASCEGGGRRFHMMILSPFSSSHEKETNLPTGYSFQTVVILAFGLVIAWQNHAYILKYVLPGVVSCLHNLKGSFL